MNGNGSAPLIDTKHPPICGWKWLEQHLHDYTHEYIEGLSIEISHSGKRLPKVNSSRDDMARRNQIKEVVKSYRK